MKFGAVSCLLLVFLSALGFSASAQVQLDQQDRVREFRLAALWQGVSGVTEAMVESAARSCRPALQASLAECDAALASAPNDPETIQIHPYCKRLSNDEFIECVKTEFISLKE